MSYAARIEDVFLSLGGRATNQELQAHVLATLTADERDELARIGLATMIAAFFRRQAARGLPQAPEIDEHGTHAQLSLLTVEEFRYVVRKYMDRARANWSKAQLAAALCFEVHGVAIDLDDPITWTA